ncbi:A/G-specific adenine glycosylase [Patescibacteria group bacterium]|nr:A/G-specific adenine glycosylase [Patescibacteria group bacterium]
MKKLLSEIKRYYRAHKRDLPWRHTRDPYKILVSEMMLQQTQVGRVLPFYKKFIREFPNARTLANAKLSAVLKMWSGLGYNRRAKYLHEAAKIIAREGIIGQKLPGVGLYTGAAVDAFAHNKPTVFVETNIRTVFFHSYILENIRMTDAQLLPLVGQALRQSKMQPRDFYAALMDYGAHLKGQGVRLNKKSAHYTRPKKFEGSTRQLRGAILKIVLHAPRSTLSSVTKNLPRSANWQKREVLRVLAQLKKEGLVRRHKGKYLV